MVRTSIVGAQAWLTLMLCSAAFGASTVFAENTDMPETLPDDDASAVSGVQSAAPPLRFEANLVALLAFPFKGDAGAMAFGFALTYGVGWGNIPFMLGLDFMSANSQMESSSEIAALDGQTVSVRANARNRTLYFDVWGRVQPPRWPVRPYIEGFIGTKLVQSQYEVILDGSTATAQASSAHDWTRSIGWGAGVDLAGLLNIAEAFSITLGFRRLHSPRATLDVHADIAGAPVVIERNVATAATMYMLGVVGRFDLAAPENAN